MTLSCLQCAFCFVPAHAKFAHEFLTLFHSTLTLAARVQLSFRDFTLSDSTAPIRFIVKLFSLANLIHSAFRLDRKTRSQRSHVFRLIGTAVLQCGHTFVGGIHTANGQ